MSGKTTGDLRHRVRTWSPTDPADDLRDAGVTVRWWTDNHLDRPLLKPGTAVPCGSGTMVINEEKDP
jgi:hypothetical protein